MGETTMQNITFEWKKCRFGYRIVPPKKGEPAGLAMLRPAGPAPDRRPGSKDFETIRPLDHHKALFRDFADLSTQRDFVEFASKWGLLTDTHDDEDLATWQVESGSMRSALASWEAGKFAGLENLFNDYRWARLAIRFRNGALALEPRNLRDAMWVQLAVSLTKREHHRACLWCKTWFPYGAGTEHRASALYCSPKCQKAHAYQKLKGAA
jgi:hypothetical protein